MRKAWPIRIQLAALVLAVALPLLALAVRDLFSDFERERRIGETTARHSAEIAAQLFAQEIDSFREQLELLAARDRSAAGRCEAMHVPRRLVAAVGLLGPDGRSVCASAPLPREYLSEVVRLTRSADRSVQLLRDPLSRGWLSVIASGLPGGERLYLLFSQQAVLESTLSGSDAQVLLVDEHGYIIARSSDPGRWIGYDASESEFATRLLAQPNGVLTAQSLDGEERIFGFTTVEGTPWRIAASFASSAVFADVHRDTLRKSLFGLITLMLAGALAVHFYRRIGRPLRQMADAAAAITQGEPLERIPVAGGTELRLLGERFNALLAARAGEELKLRESEQRFRLMADAAPVMIWLDDADKRARYFNRGWLAFTGRTLDEEIALGWSPLLHLEDYERVVQSYDAAFARRSEFSMEYRLRRQDGEYRWLLDHGLPRFDAQGEFAGYIGVCIDITERRLAEERLRISEQRLNQAQAIARVGNWETDVSTGRVVWSDAMYAIFGIDRDATDEAQRRRVTEALTRGRPGMFEKSITLPDRSVRFLRGWFGTEAGIDGEAGRLVGVVQDITEERRAEDRQATLTGILEATSDFVCIAEVDGQLRYVNAAGRQLVGLGDDEEVRELDVRGFAPAEQEQDLLTAALDGALERGHWSGELELAARDGRRIPVSVVVLLHRDRQQRPQYLSLVARDITPQKRMERALREGEGRLRAIIDTEPECVNVVSPGGQLLDMNASGLVMIEAASLAEVQHRPVIDLIEPRHHPAFLELHRAVMAGESRELEFEIIGLHGGRRKVRTHAVPLRNQRGRIVAHLAITHDVTERRRAQRVVRESQAQLEGIVQSAMDAIVSIDEEQRIVVFNRAAEQMFLCPAAEAIGKPVERFVPERFREAHRRGVRRFAESNEPHRALGAPATLWGLRADGSEFPIEASVSKVEVEGHKLFTVMLRDISARLAAQQALEESQDRLRMAMQAARMGTWYWDIVADHTHYSEEVGPLYGLPPGAQHRHREAFARAVHRHDLPRLRDARDAALQGASGYDIEYRVIWPDGSIHWVGAHGEVFRDGAGNPLSMAGVVFDLTEKRLAEEAAERGRAQLELGVRAAGLGTWYRDLVTGEVRYSPELVAMFGFSAEDQPSREQLFARVDEQDRSRCEQAVRAMEESGAPLDESFRAVWPDGSMRWVHANGRMFRDTNGEPARAAGAMIDLTEQRAARQALIDGEARLGLAMRAAHMAWWQRDLERADGIHAEEYPTLLGLPPGTRIGHEDFIAAVHPDDRERIVAAMRLAGERGETINQEYRVVWPDGSVHWLNTRAQVLRDAADRARLLVGVDVDVTEARELEESATRLGRLLEESLNEIYVFDAASLRFQQVNRGARENLGYEMAELTGMTLLELAPQLAEEGIGRLLASLRRDERREARLITEFRRKNGSRYAVEVHLQRSELQGAPVFVAFVADITDKVRQQRRLEQYAARLKTLSRRLMEVQEAERRHIARELHDEIGQSLTALKINLQMLGDADGNVLIEESVGIADQVLSEVRDLSLRLRPSLLDDLGLAPALRWYLERQKRVGGLEVTLETAGIDERLPAEVETTAFRVIQEAVTNCLRHAAARHLTVRVERDTDGLALAVRDDGCGFDVDICRKQARRGDSFGLLGMRERAMLIGGELEIDSAPGKGTVVRARLPVAAAQRTERRRIRRPRKTPAGGIASDDESAAETRTKTGANSGSG